MSIEDNIHELLGKLKTKLTLFKKINTDNKLDRNKIISEIRSIVTKLYHNGFFDKLIPKKKLPDQCMISLIVNRLTSQEI